MYDLRGYNDRLVEHWQKPAPQRKGYRQPADWVNVTLLRRAMDRAGLSTLGREAESKYERLHSDDPMIVTEVSKLLAQEGIDIEQLEKDFVSYGVIRTHLKECLDAERAPQTSSDWERDAIEITRERAHQKAKEAINSLLNKGEIAAGENTAVRIRIDIDCPDCNSRTPVERALRRGVACDCPEVTSSQ